MQELKDYILVWDVLPAELCDEIIQETDIEMYWTPATAHSDYRSKYRNCNALSLDLFKNGMYKELLHDYVIRCISIYQNKYGYPSPKVILNMDLLRYKKGEYYKKHVDNHTNTVFPRYLSLIFILNDDYEEGGLTFFPDTNYSLDIKATKGQVVIFPSNFMFPHRVNEVTKGTRYSIVSWVS